MTNNIEATKALGKEAIIQLANKILAEEYPEIKLLPKEYEIGVWANKTDVEVKYRRLIRYTPLAMQGSNLTFDLSVNVITRNVSPFDFWPGKKLYRPEGQDKKNFEFVLKHFSLPVKGFRNSVSEQEDHYFISLTNKSAYGKYFIDKVTGEQRIGAIQGSYVPMPPPRHNKENVDPDPLIEIKD